MKLLLSSMLILIVCLLLFIVIVTPSPEEMIIDNISTTISTEVPMDTVGVITKYGKTVITTYYLIDSNYKVIGDYSTVNFDTLNTFNRKVK